MSTTSHLKRTPHVVAAIADQWPELRMLTVTDVGRYGHRRIHVDGVGMQHIVPGSGVGGLRDLGVQHALHALQPHRPTVTWLLNTDADTIVPPDWALDHLRFAAAGVVGVAGCRRLPD